MLDITVIASTENSTKGFVEVLRVPKGSSIVLKDGGRIDGPVVIRGAVDTNIAIDAN